MNSRRVTTFNFRNIILLILLMTVTVGLVGCGKDNGAGPDSNSDKNIVAKAKTDSETSTFVDLLGQAGLTSQLKSNNTYTAFIPTNSAFDKLPDGFLDSLSQDKLKKILNYHLLSEKMMKSDLRKTPSVQSVEGDSIFIKVGSNIELNHNATLTTGDIEASNGVIHKLDDVVIPDMYLNVFEIIHKRYSLEKFACHCTSGRTNLDEVLESEGSEFTVFAPTDEAFENFNKNVDDLSDSDLKHLLNYHVIDQKLMSDELSDGQTFTTLNGEDLTINVSADGTISINGGQATVIKSDLEGVNGVVYVVDTVVDPHQ